MSDQHTTRLALPPAPPTALRLSKQTREQIATLKRRTQVRHMNVLCRWALCRSLQEPSPPPLGPTDTATEIEWGIFVGAGGAVWWPLLLESASVQGLRVDASVAEALLRAHVARGMSYLVGDQDIKAVTSLARMTLGLSG